MSCLVRTPRNREPADQIDNRLRSFRTAKGLSQGALAGMAGVTRQAVWAIEANQYLPTTAVALRLAHALGTRVEDLFNLITAGDLIEGEWIGAARRGVDGSSPERVKVARVGHRLLVRPLAGLGDVLNFTVPADGLLMPQSTVSRSTGRKASRVQVCLLRDRQTIDKEVIVAGCDPAIFLLGDYLRRRRDQASVVGWPMGSAAAVEALKRGEVHVAGLHIVDPKSGESNLPYLRTHLRGLDVTVITFASWEQGLIIRAGNAKGIRGVKDLARRDVAIVNRENGAGARFLLDRCLKVSGIAARRVRGYDRVASSHVEVARLVGVGQADVGIGVRSAARLLGLEFIPLQEERYDLVIPTAFLSLHPTVSMFLDTLVSRTFRTEIEALGGYDTRETGRVLDWQRAQRP